MDNGPTDPYHFASLIAYDADVAHVRAGSVLDQGYAFSLWRSGNHKQEISIWLTNTVMGHSSPKQKII